MNFAVALIGLAACAGLGGMGWRGTGRPRDFVACALIAGICLGLLF